MFKRLLQKVTNTKPDEPKGDTMYCVGPDGKPTNMALHEALMEDVDDSEFIQQTYEELKAQGASEEILSLFKK